MWFAGINVVYASSANLFLINERGSFYRPEISSKSVFYIFLGLYLLTLCARNRNLEFSFMLYNPHITTMWPSKAYHTDNPLSQFQHIHRFFTHESGIAINQTDGKLNTYSSSFRFRVSNFCLYVEKVVVCASKYNKKTPNFGESKFGVFLTVVAHIDDF